MKSSRRNPFHNPFLRSALAVTAAVFCNSSLYAVDYSFGSITSDFTITASDQARALGAGTSSGVSFNDNAWGAVYDRGSNQDATYMHFDLTSLAGMTINGSVNLNLVIDATYGGAISSGVVGYANSAWSYPGATPGLTTISGADPSGNYSSGQTATAAIDNTTFQGFVNNPTTFYGLAITAGDGSTAHFSGPATLTGNYTGGEVRVLGGTDWSAAAWDNGSKTLSIAGSSDVTGGLVAMVSGTTLSVSDSATLGGGSFSGAIGNNGTLVFGSSANQTLSGAISGSGVLNKTGSGTLTLSGANSYTGLTTVSTGTLSLASSNALPTTGAVTIGSGATLSNDAPANTSFNIGNITLNGGTLAATSSPASNLGNFHLKGNVTVGGSTMSTISADVRVIQNETRSFTVADVDGGSGVDLLVSGKLGHYNNNSWGYATKEGAGTMKLTGPVEIGGITVNAGKLLLEDSAADWSAFATGLTNNSQVEVNVTSGSRTLGVNSSGSGSMVKSGAGSLTLTGYNSGNGGITVNEGTLVASKSQQDYGIHTLGTGALTINNGGTLRSTVNWTTSSQWNGTSVGAVTINNGGTWSIEALGQTIRNGLFLNGGSITATTSNGDWGALHLKSGVTAGGGVTSSIGADTALSGSQTITVNGGSQLNYSGVIHDEVGASFPVPHPNSVSSGITKAGAGTLVLSGANSYTGGTSVEGGTLQISGSGTIGSGGLAVKNSAALNLGTTSQTLGGSLNGGGSGNGAVGTISNGGLNLNGNSAYLQNGTFTMDLSGGGNSRLWIGGDANATVELGGNNTSTFADSNSTIIGHETTGTAGTVKLLSATALGPNGQQTQVHSGTLDLNGQTGIPVSSIMLNGANMANSNASTAASYAGTVTFNGTGTAQIGGAGDITLGGELTNGGFTKVGGGTLTLSGTSTYSGATTVSAGTLLVTGALGNSAVSVSSNATVGGSGTIGGSLSFAGDSFFDIFMAIGGDALDVTGTISFTGSGFGIDNLTGVNWGEVASGTYTLATGTLNSENLGNFGLANAYVLGDGRQAYFQSGSLQLVVIPEPRAALLGGLGMLALLRRRR